MYKVLWGKFPPESNTCKVVVKYVEPKELSSVLTTVKSIGGTVIEVREVKEKK